MSAFKIIFAGDSLISCGDLGRVGYYDLFSKELINKIDIGDAFISSIAVNENEKKIAVGNSNGDLFILGAEDKSNMITLKPHFKTIRCLVFSKDQTKIIVGSDDFTISVIDIESKQVNKLEGHLDRVTSIQISK